jgi:hypothetical protein
VYDDLAPASTTAPLQSTGKLSKTMAGRLTRRPPGARGGEARPAVSRVRADRTADRIECASSPGQILDPANATRWNTQSRVTSMAGLAPEVPWRGGRKGAESANPWPRVRDQRNAGMTFEANSSKCVCAQRGGKPGGSVHE